MLAGMIVVCSITPSRIAFLANVSKFLTIFDNVEPLKKSSNRIFRSRSLRFSAVEGW